MNALFTVLLSSCLCLDAPAETPSLRLVQTIPLPGVQGRFDHFAIDVGGKRLFVAALGNNTLEVLDLGPGTRTKSVSGMAKPTGVLYLPSRHTILVANGDDGTVRVLDASSQTGLQTLRGLDDADNMRFDSKAGLAWVGYGEGALAVVDPAAGRVLGSVKLAAHPESFQLEPGANRVFVNVPDAKQIAVVDRERRVVLGHWPMEEFQDNFPMALDGAHARLFVGCRKPSRLVVLDTSTGKPVADLAISGDTDDLFYDAKRKRLYVSCGEGFVDTVEQAGANSYTRISRLPTAPGARTSFFSPELDRFYLAVPARGSQAAEVRVYQPLK